MKKRMYRTKKKIIKLCKDFRHMIWDPIVTALWEPCYVFMKGCQIMWQRSKYMAMQINSKTAPIDIPEFMLPKPKEDNVIYLPMNENCL